MRQYEQAIAHYRKILELSPASVWVQRQIGLALSQQGLNQEALVLVSKLQTPNSPTDQLTLMAYFQARAGQHDEALKLLRQLKEKTVQEPVSPVNFAYVYVGLGDQEQALAW